MADENIPIFDNGRDQPGRDGTEGTGLDGESFVAYAEALPQIDPRIRAVRRLGQNEFPGSPRGTVVFEAQVGVLTQQAFVLAFVPGEDGARIGIYQALRSFGPEGAPVDKVDALGDWWEAENPRSPFQVGLSEDLRVLTLACEGPADRYAVQATRGWVSELVNATAQVAGKLRELFD